MNQPDAETGRNNNTDPAAMLREMARIVRPGGTVAICDEVTHPYTWMREEHHDVWLGFSHEQVTALIVVEDQTADGDRVTSRWTLHGNHKGRAVTLPGITSVASRPAGSPRTGPCRTISNCSAGSDPVAASLSPSGISPDGSRPRTAVTGAARAPRMPAAPTRHDLSS